MVPSAAISHPNSFAFSIPSLSFTPMHCERPLIHPRMFNAFVPTKNVDAINCRMADYLYVCFVLLVCLLTGGHCHGVHCCMWQQLNIIYFYNIQQ